MKTNAVRFASGLAPVVGRVEAAAAGTALGASGLGQVLVDGQEERPESGPAWPIVIHVGYSGVLTTLYGVPPSEILIK